MDLQLKGKRALVTGSSTGVGEGIAKVLAEEGAIAIVHGRDEARTQQVAEEIIANGGAAFTVTGDLATDDGAKRVADQSIRYLGSVDILVNNAGVYSNSRWLETAPDDWSSIYNVNVVSMVRLIRLLVPQMKDLGWGRIIQISSADAIQPFAQMCDYSATKADQHDDQPCQGTCQYRHHRQHDFAGHHHQRSD